MPYPLAHETSFEPQPESMSGQSIEDEYLNIFPLPPMPSDCVDPHDVPPSGQPVMLRPLIHIRRTDSTRWGEKPLASMRALLESEVTEQTERLFRTHHRSLGPCSSVWVAREGPQKKIWVVAPGPTFPVLDTHAGGREIHFMPPGVSQPTDFGSSPHTLGPFRPDPLAAVLNPRRFLSEDDLALLRKIFPSAVGARVFISGFVVLLFKSLADVHDSWQNEGSLDTFGNLRVNYDIIEDSPARCDIAIAARVSSEPDNLDHPAALGLKLRFPHGLEAVTVPTHLFTTAGKDRQDQPPSTTDWYTRVKLAVSRIRPISWGKKPTAEMLRELEVNSPLGKAVWLAGEDQKVGTISMTYDPLSPTPLPFPNGYRHDLSLVTSPNLPNITTPVGFPRITRWGGYREVLDGNPIFAISLSMQTGRLTTKGLSSAAANRAPCALAEGSEYLWDRSTGSQSVSLLWRIAHDGNRSKGCSGSVLCLGQPQDPTCSAVCFQNFEATLYSREFLKEDERLPPGGDVHQPILKGGFLLPTEIRRAEILCEGVAHAAAQL